ncbi:hypothetical protein IP88_06905 [alpha proteobacterium AAP81b]|nr:hypothetical protein IP88_06905 [alpha proteobacterium AAP81b]
MTLQSAIIIGASRGLGLGLARALAEHGASVTATARGDAPDLAAAAAASAGRMTLATVDIDDDASIAALVAAVAGKSFDLVFVNAGAFGPRHSSPTAVTPAEFAALLWTNALAPIRVAEALLPSLADNGTLAFMSSRLGSVSLNTEGGYDLYRASKAALNTLTRSLAVRLKGRPVSLLTLHPGWVRTDMGGPNATLSVEESVAGLVKVLDANRTPGHRFVQYDGQELAW